MCNFVEQNRKLFDELDNLINVNCKIGLDKSGSLLVYPIDDGN